MTLARLLAGLPPTVQREPVVLGPMPVGDGLNGLQNQTERCCARLEVFLRVMPSATELARTAKEKGQNMEQHIEQYQAPDGGVTLHTWTEVQGSKKENFYITGTSGAAIPMWFRNVLRQKNLSDITDFPYCPSYFYE